MSSAPTSSQLRCMKVELYEAAEKGNFVIIQNYFNRASEEELYTLRRDTVLHIYVASAPRAPNVAHQVTEIACNIIGLSSDLLYEVNTVGHSALHLAAKYDHVQMVRAFLDIAKKEGKLRQMLSEQTKEGETALHYAARFNNPKVVSMLIVEDLQMISVCNTMGESALYVAADGGHLDVVKVMLAKAVFDSFRAFYAALSNKHEGVAALFLEKNEDLARTQKQRNKMVYPLHIAASKDLIEVVKRLLQIDVSLAFLQDEQGRTALHYAASEGHLDVMMMLVSLCPNCCDLVDNNGENVLHTALQNVEKFASKEDIIKFGKKRQHLAEVLLYAKNGAGQSPLEIYEALPSLKVDDERKEKKEEKEEKEEKEAKEKKKEMINVNLAVSVFIIAAVYGATVGLPGGFDDYGYAKLARARGYKVFDIASGVSAALNCASAFSHICLLLTNGREGPEDLVDLIFSFTSWGFVAFMVSLGAARYIVTPDVDLFFRYCISFGVALICCGCEIYRLNPQVFRSFVKLMLTPFLVFWMIVQDARVFICRVCQCS